jgi:hypothetical protein
MAAPSKRTPEAEQLLFRALELGMGFNSAADLIGVSGNTLLRWRTDDPELALKCTQAKARGKMRVVGKLIELIDKGNLGAICFWLKTRTDEFKEHKDNDQVTKADLQAAFREAAAQIQAVGGA